MNDEQIAYWNGQAGQRWTEEQVVLDRALAAFGRGALDRAGVALREHVLDIGCGCGDSSLALADRVGSGGAVVGIDISTQMLARARDRAQSRANLTFVHGDAATMAFPRPFDLLFSRFGVMFFEDPIATFTHLRSATTSGGRLTFVCWRAYEDNPWTAIPLNAVRRIVPEVTPPSSDGPGPCAFADAAKVERILSSAGFRDIACDRFDADVVLAGDELEDAVRFAVGVGPASRLLATAAPEAQLRAMDEVRRALESMRTPTGFVSSGSSWLVTARA
jgi:SAM-dependent methyltransferase